MGKFSLRLVAAFVACALLFGVWLGTGLAAGSPSPGSDQDPLVTKSYVDQVIAALVNKSQLDQTVAELRQQIDELTRQVGAGGGAEGTTLQVVVVPAGQKLIGFEGTEFILRAGAGKIIGSTAGGVPDLTGATDLSDGAAIPKNHLLLFPKNDNRGLLAVQQLTVMVRGRWSIEP